ncbi:hypothetical protein FQA39_LY18303 [Lamprigera yunnana]|nr:hypothetical protein FQA39_LY18303 [Lamprigera yunnana]
MGATKFDNDVTYDWLSKNFEKETDLVEKRYLVMRINSKLNKSKSKWISVELYYPFEFASVVKIFGRSKQYVIFKEEERIQFHEQRENTNKYFQTFDTMWKPRPIGSKTLTFEMIKEKKILKIEDMSGNEVYLGWESVSEVWSLESVLRYRLSYSSGSNFKHFYKDVIRAVAEMSGDVKINIYYIINRLSEKFHDVCCMLEVLLFMLEKALFDVQLEKRIQKQEIQFIKKMWMLYAQKHWTKALDLKSAVERLYEELGALEIDADHEAIYGIERYYTVQQCEELRDKYKIGRKVCRKFLKGKTCSQRLVKRMSEIGLRHFLDRIIKYIKNCSNSDTSSSSDEEECKSVEQNGEDSKTTEEEELKKRRLCHIMLGYTWTMERLICRLYFDYGAIDLVGNLYVLLEFGGLPHLTVDFGGENLYVLIVFVADYAICSATLGLWNG